jgi:ABC-type glutathione transport system ATPase component
MSIVHGPAAANAEVARPARSCTAGPGPAARARGPHAPRLRGKDISVVFQEPMSSLNPVFTVGEQIAECCASTWAWAAPGARAHAGAAGRSRHPEPRARLNAYPHETVRRPAAARDDRHGDRLRAQAADRRRADHRARRHGAAQIVDLLARLQKRQKMSVLFISHDLGLVGEFADQVVVMRHGEVRERGTRQTCSVRRRTPTRGPAGLPSAPGRQAAPAAGDRRHGARPRPAAATASPRAAGSTPLMLGERPAQELLAEGRPVQAQDAWRP